MTLPADVRREVPRTTRRQDLVTALLGTWLAIGAFVDGWAHRSRGELETFFTPWHALFYTGFAATAGWILWLGYRNLREGRSPMEAVPDGYQLGVIGLGLFVLGGIGDGIWHSVFGIETALDALLSPTHILLFGGAILFLTSPFRAAARDAAYQPQRLADFWPPLLSMSLAALEVSFFFLYATEFATWTVETPYDPETGSGEVVVAFGILSVMVTTVILIGAMLLLMRQWSLPFGAMTFLFTFIGTFMQTLTGFEDPWHIFAPLAGGLTADLLIRRLRPDVTRPWTIWVTALVTPIAMWSVYFAAAALFSEVAWQVELWGGAILFAGLTGLGLSLLVVPPRSARAQVS